MIEKYVSFLARNKWLHLCAEPLRLKGIQYPPAGFCQNYGRDENVSVKIFHYCFEDILARGDLVHFGVRQGGPGECWVGEDAEGWTGGPS